MSTKTKSKRTRTLFNKKGGRVGLVDEDRNLYTCAGNPSRETYINKRGRLVQSNHHKQRLEALNEGRFKPFEEED